MFCRLKNVLKIRHQWGPIAEHNARCQGHATPSLLLAKCEIVQITYMGCIKGVVENISAVCLSRLSAEDQKSGNYHFDFHSKHRSVFFLYQIFAAQT